LHNFPGSRFTSCILSVQCCYIMQTQSKWKHHRCDDTGLDMHLGSLHVRSFIRDVAFKLAKQHEMTPWRRLPLMLLSLPSRCSEEVQLLGQRIISLWWAMWPCTLDNLVAWDKKTTLQLTHYIYHYIYHILEYKSYNLYTIYIFWTDIRITLRVSCLSFTHLTHHALSLQHVQVFLGLLQKSLLAWFIR
jgi:hypothetical protein